jgi:hypothetical protein
MNREATFQGAAVSQPPAAARYPVIWQSPTPKFQRFPSAAWRALRKVGTLFPLFKALPTGAILSAPSIELPQSKSRRRLENFASRTCEIMIPSLRPEGLHEIR